MTSNPDADPLSMAAGIADALQRHGLRDIVITGSTALGVWARARQSRDIDFCATVPPESVARLTARYDGFVVGSGAVPDVIRLRIGDWDVDVFVSNDAPYDRACVMRATTVQTSAGPLRVVSAEDLLIHKLIKLRTDRRRALQDLADMRAIFDAHKDNLDHEYLDHWLPPADAELLRTLAEEDDESLLKRLLGPG